MSEATSSADLPETASDPIGHEWFQVSEGADEYCHFWGPCGYVGHPKHRTLAQVRDGSEVPTR